MDECWVNELCEAYNRLEEEEETLAERKMKLKLALVTLLTS